MMGDLDIGKKKMLLSSFWVLTGTWNHTSRCMSATSMLMDRGGWEEEQETSVADPLESSQILKSMEIGEHPPTIGGWRYKGI